MNIKRPAIFGSRTLGGNEIVAKIERFIKKTKPEYLITAGQPGGVCQCAIQAARNTATPIKLFFLDRTRARGKFHWRSVAMLRDCDYAVFFHDGKSKGTANEMKLAAKFGKPSEYHKCKIKGPVAELDDTAFDIDFLGTNGNTID